MCRQTMKMGKRGRDECVFVLVGGVSGYIHRCVCIMGGVVDVDDSFVCLLGKD